MIFISFSKQPYRIFLKIQKDLVSFTNKIIEKYIKASERRSDAIGFKNGYCPKFYLPKLFESKFLYPFSTLFQILHGKPLNREKMIFQRLIWEFRQKIEFKRLHKF